VFYTFDIVKVTVLNRDARGLPKKVYIIKIESKISKIIKRCATLRTTVFDRHDDRPRIAINTRVKLDHRAGLLIWQVSLTPLF